MIASIKNISSETIDFGSFSLEKNNSITLDWIPSIITHQTFGMIIAMFDLGKIALLDENGNEELEDLTSEFYTLTKSGNRSSVISTVVVRKAKLFLNQKFNEMLKGQTSI